MRAVIFGAGAVGLFTAAHWQQKGIEVMLVSRSQEQADAVQAGGITVRATGHTWKEYVRAADSERLTDIDFTDIDIMVNALKQTNLPEWFEQIKHIIPPNIKEDVPILFLQNGMGHIEEASKYGFFKAFPAIVTHGIMKHSHTEVEHTGKGALIMDDSLNKGLVTLLHNEPDYPVHQTGNVEDYQKKKLIVNAVVNPITALYGIRNGELIENEQLLAIGRSVFDEATPILKLKDDDWSFVLDVLRKTAKNESSMKVDIDHGRKTEVDAILGFIIREGEKIGLPVTVTQKLLYDIHQLEYQRGI
ncbi:ketopantoate reductase family protein [Salisediminibacterium beveridgei]|uniref:2-dehydropantoate 2-reductase n=1 Tax=Salisediminibacterium beveridgei TaxID=632773 RepID=A0A1D7QW96_9BACI|nr:2-dehydropantoate 2-reductase [Salisediminibacterium beveridgei]AOM83285.1 2-dehydropantoate 2-reductase [Salisediminibacterium beveridgei]